MPTPKQGPQTMQTIETLTNAQILTAYNWMADKPVTKFENREKAVRRLTALAAAKGTTIERVARDAGLLKAAKVAAPAKAAPATAAAPVEAPATEAKVLTAADFIAIGMAADLAAKVEAFIARQAKPVKAATGERAPTTIQATIIELCSRTQGATAKELCEGIGWPTIAARATCEKVAARFGYTLTEKPKADGRGISFYFAKG